jgi:outer membrane receptor protein involved in Fe transport
MQRLFCGASATMMILGAGLLAPSMALAQDGEGNENLEAVVVTGTRLAGFDAPTPVTSLAGAELQANNARNVADLITDVPQLRVRRNIGQTLLPVGLSQIDLRGLNGVNSSQRTLVMIDGRRMAPTAYNGWIDANVIPTALLNRVEVVTGGASAAYGSDAVAGVVNFILDRKFTGLRADLSYGQSKYRDNRQPGASVAFGTGFNNDRGHLIASAEYFRDSGQLSQEHRPWGRQHWCQNATTRNGRSFVFYRSGCNLSQITAGGVTATNAPAALQNIQFGPGGTVLPFQRGTDVGGTFMTGGGPGSLFFADQTIAPKIRRYGGFAGLTYDITDNVQAFGDVLYSNVFIYADSAPPNDSATATTAALIQRDNAYLPAAIRTILANNPGIANFRLGRYYAEDGGSASNIGTKHTRYTFGFKGDFNANWSWEAYGAIARTKYYNKSFHQRNQTKFNFAADAVVNPANGQVVCRATLQNNPAAASCVPFNPFGPGSVSQAAVAYYTGTSQMDADLEQDVWAATVRGTPFRLPAGDVSIAFGAEARRDSIDAVGDPVSNALQWKSVNQPGYAGKVNVKEAFGEIAVPILADRPLFKKLDVNAAGRVTDYSVSGTVETWKLGANYEPNDWVRFRGTLSRDIRAPTAFELFRPSAASLINVIADPAPGPTFGLQTQVFQSTGGNTGLKPEIAKTFTGGIVLSPPVLPGFRMSVDYYKINIKDVISNLTIQQTLDQCYVAKNQEYCALILRNAQGQIFQINGTDINSARLKTAGVDIEAQYRFSVDNFIPWGGNITLRSLGSYTEYRRQTTSGVVVNLAGQNYNGIPFWRVNSSITYDNGPVMFRVSSRYMSSGLNNKAFVQGVNIEDNRMPSAHYIDLAASYQVNQNLQFYANVNNLFNQWPALDPNPITEPGYQGGGNYDLVGQWFSLGVRLSY